MNDYLKATIRIIIITYVLFAYIFPAVGLRDFQNYSEILK